MRGFNALRGLPVTLLEVALKQVVEMTLLLESLAGCKRRPEGSTGQFEV